MRSSGYIIYNLQARNNVTRVPREVDTVVIKPKKGEQRDARRK